MYKHNLPSKGYSISNKSANQPMTSRSYHHVCCHLVRNLVRQSQHVTRLHGLTKPL